MLKKTTPRCQEIHFLYLSFVLEPKLLVKFWKPQIIANCRTQTSNGAVYCNNFLTWNILLFKLLNYTHQIFFSQKKESEYNFPQVIYHNIFRSTRMHKISKSITEKLYFPPCLSEVGKLAVTETLV